MTARKKTNRTPKSSRARNRRLARKQATKLNFEALEPRQLLAAVQIDFSSAFNQDSIRNFSGGNVDSVDSPLDGVSRLVTDSFVQNLDPVNGNGLPDDGAFSSSDLNPSVQLGYNNNDDGDNVIFNPSSTSIALAEGQIGSYDNLHIFATATNGAASLQVDLQYADGTETFTTVVTDWLSEITDGTISGDATQYYLIDGMDRDVNGFNNANDVAIFGFDFDVDPTRVLEGFSLSRVSGGNLVVLGATGESAEFAELTDGEGFLWDFDTGGQITDGTSDAYDGGLGLSGFPFQDVFRQDGRDVVFGPGTIDNVEVTRKVHVPDDQGYARFLEIVTNNTASVQNFTVSIASDLGSDSSTVNVDTSSGDTTFDTADDWIVTDDADGTDSIRRSCMSYRGPTDNNQMPSARPVQ